MPAIASLEDLKAAQKEGVSIYAMLYALCSMLYENGAASVGKMYVEPHGQARCSILNACVGRHPPSDLGTGRPRGGGLLLPGQAVVTGTHSRKTER